MSLLCNRSVMVLHNDHPHKIQQQQDKLIVVQRTVEQIRIKRMGASRDSGYALYVGQG